MPRACRPPTSARSDEDSLTVPLGAAGLGDGRPPVVADPRHPRELPGLSAVSASPAARSPGQQGRAAAGREPPLGGSRRWAGAAAGFGPALLSLRAAPYFMKAGRRSASAGEVAGCCRVRLGHFAARVASSARSLRPARTYRRRALGPRPRAGQQGFQAQAPSRIRKVVPSVAQETATSLKCARRPGLWSGALPQAPCFLEVGRCLGGHVGWRDV